MLRNRAHFGTTLKRTRASRTSLSLKAVRQRPSPTPSPTPLPNMTNTLYRVAEGEWSDEEDPHLGEAGETMMFDV